jgi:hypothetical protein
MVREFPPAPEVNPQGVQGFPKNLGPGDPGKGERPKSPQCFHGVLLSPRKGPGRDGGNDRGENFLVREALPQPSEAIPMTPVVIAGKEKGVRLPQGADRLSERPGREQPAVAERPRCVQEHEVQVPGQLEVLQAVVQQKDVGAQVPPGGHAGLEPAGAGVHYDAGKAPGQLEGLVPHLRRLMKKALPVRQAGDPTTPPPVAPAEDGHPPPLFLQKPGQIRGDRGFSRPPRGEIPHAHHRRGQTSDFPPTPAVKPPSGPGARFVEGGKEE